MYDHSYNPNTLASVLRKRDFLGIPTHNREAFRNDTINAATQSALNIFNNTNPITKFHLKKKSAFRIKELENDLVVRKLSLNLKKIIKTHQMSRSFIVTILQHFLEESVALRVYRLDIKSFYESFSINEIENKLFSLRKISPHSKQLIKALLSYYSTIGGEGLPRGMAISAILSDFMMEEFDSSTRNHPNVYLYGRYVDDIIIITNHDEDEFDLIDEIKHQLPKGLHLNERKQAIKSLPDKHKALGKQQKPSLRFSIDYLGYQFHIYDKPKDSEDRQIFRLVQVEIAQNKIKKIKLRIIRTFIDFLKTRNASLLLDRIKYLTSNFSIIDKNTGKRKLAGIYHSYPLLSPKSQSLAELDKFLRNAILSKKGAIFFKSSSLIPSSLKRRLLAQNFTRGHANRHFIYFSPTKINQIQECWINE